MNRHSFRAEWHDYNEGLYFVTICTENRLKLFGEVINETMDYSLIGNIVKDAIVDIPNHSPNTEIINFVVMPNHVHIMISVGSNTNHDSSLATGCLKPPRHSEYECRDYHYNSLLSVIIRSFKASCTRKVKQHIWQRSFHEHIIRSTKEFNYIMNYIDLNVFSWQKDCFYS